MTLHPPVHAVQVICSRSAYKHFGFPLFPIDYYKSFNQIDQCCLLNVIMRLMTPICPHISCLPNNKCRLLMTDNMLLTEERAETKDHITTPRLLPNLKLFFHLQPNLNYSFKNYEIIQCVTKLPTTSSTYNPCQCKSFYDEI